MKVWHYHVAVFGLPYVPQKELVEEWGRGTVSIEAMEAYENPGSYMARYMGKDFAGENLTGHRRFFTSQGLYPDLADSTLLIPDFSFSPRAFSNTYDLVCP